MRSRYFSLLLALLGLAGVLVVGTARTEEPDNAPPGGVEVLTRGPIHEAYADPADRRPQPSPVIAKKPPDPIDELPPDQKPDGPNVQWIPGFWAWDEERSDYLWVSGFWRAPPPGRQWMPGHWQRVEGGWQWVPGFWGVPGQRDIDLVPPPPPSVESGPSVPPPAEDDLYQPGCWIYRDARYLWQPGCWYAPRPDYLWVPSHYLWSPCGCVFVPGYWDYPLQDRGLLFAPVCIDRRVYLQPNFCFTPTHCIPCDGLFAGLFVRPGCCCYFFGDFFGLRYERQGFCPWLDCRVGHHPCDPLWCHYEHHRAWEGDLHGLYAGRRNGDIPPPPRTLAQQHTLRQNLHHEAGPIPVKAVTVVAALHQVDPQTVKLHALPHEQRVQEQQAARHLHEVARQRIQAEGDLLAKTPPPTRPTDPVQKIKLAQPAMAAPLKDGPPLAAAPPPPAPTLHHEHPQAVHAAPVPPAPPPGAALKQDFVPPHNPKTEAPPPPKHDPTPPAPHKEPAPPPAPKKEPAPLPPSPPPPPPPKLNIAPPLPKINVAPPPPPPPMKAVPAPPPPRPAAPPPPAQHHHK